MAEIMLQKQTFSNRRQYAAMLLPPALRDIGATFPENPTAWIDVADASLAYTDLTEARFAQVMTQAEAIARRSNSRPVFEDQLNKRYDADLRRIRVVFDNPVIYGLIIRRRDEEKGDTFIRRRAEGGPDSWMRRRTENRENTSFTIYLPDDFTGDIDEVRNYTIQIKIVGWGFKIVIGSLTIDQAGQPIEAL